MTGVMGKIYCHMMMDMRMVPGHAILDEMLLEVHESERKRNVLALLVGTKNVGGFYLEQKVLLPCLCRFSEKWTLTGKTLALLLFIFYLMPRVQLATLPCSKCSRLLPCYLLSFLFLNSVSSFPLHTSCFLFFPKNVLSLLVVSYFCSNFLFVSLLSSCSFLLLAIGPLGSFVYPPIFFQLLCFNYLTEFCLYVPPVCS